MTTKFDVFNNNSDKNFYLSLHKNYSNKNKLVSYNSVHFKIFFMNIFLGTLDLMNTILLIQFSKCFFNKNYDYNFEIKTKCNLYVPEK
jgi:hypothetical protein